MGTFIVFILLVGVVGLIIRNIRKEKKNGKSPICGCNCKDCGGCCEK